jgi:hypothetical protein
LDPAGSSQLCSLNLDGRQWKEVTLAVMMRPFAVGWDKQQIAIDLTPGTSKSD